MMKSSTHYVILILMHITSMNWMHTSVRIATTIMNIRFQVLFKTDLQAL